LSTSCPGRIYPWERPGTRCTGEWVGHSAVLDKWEKFRPHRHLIHGFSSSKRITIPAPRIVKVLHFSRYMVGIYSDIIFRDNLLSVIQVVTRGRTDMTKKILAFHNSA